MCPDMASFSVRAQRTGMLIDGAMVGDIEVIDW
jgi:hypothetical protein